MGKDWDAPWKYPISDHGFTDGGDRKPAPSFSSSRNPTCNNCGKRKRTWKGGPPECTCDQPSFDDVTQRLSDRQRFQEWAKTWLIECHRVLPPGGVIKSFGGTRMYHRLAAAMEEVGFVDVGLIAWSYGSGFPKSLNVGKAIDKQAGALREISGYKPGVGGENLNDIVRGNKVRTTDDQGGTGLGAYGAGAKQKRVMVPITVPATTEAKAWEGWGTALKPAWEIVLVGRKP